MLPAGAGFGGTLLDNSNLSWKLCVIAGLVILIWPELALWIVAVLLGGGLILSGITGLTALRDSGVVNPPMRNKIALWLSIVLGVLLIILGSAGSAILLGV